MSAMTEANVPTPALIIDWSIAQRNAKRLAETCKKFGKQLRPHTKTHKSLKMAKLQMELGSVGLTVAKVGEAYVMSQASDDIFIAYPALDPARTTRLAELAKTKKVRAGIDSIFTADALAAAAQAAGVTFGILVDVDTGMHRTGVQSPEEALALAQHISKTKGLRLDGIMFFPGQVLGSVQQQSETQLPAVDKIIGDVIDLWKKHGLEAKVVSGGSTPTAFQSNVMPHVTEIRPGTYIYNDWNTVAGKWCSIDDVAARVLCTVVSEAVPGKFVIDAGTKTLTSDRNAMGPETMGHGHVVEYPKGKISRLSEEHGEVLINDGAKPKLGERVHVIPNHICPCVNLQDFVWLKHEDGTLEKLSVEARGLLS